MIVRTPASSRPHRTSTAFALVVGLATVTARAQTTGDAAVEEHLRRGVELRRSGQDEAAFAEYEAAYAARSEPRTAAQLALVCQATGRWLRAEALLRESLATPADPWIVRNRAALDGALAVVVRHLATVEVVADVPGAIVRINGEEVGPLPLRGGVRVVAGSVSVEVAAEGYEALVRRFVTSPGETVRERLSLVRAASPVVPVAVVAPAPVVVPVVGPAARVVVDRGPLRALSVGAFVGAGVLVAAGVTAVVLREVAAAGYNEDCDPGDARDRCGTLRDQETTAQATAWVTLPLGAVLAATGVYLSLRGRSAAPASAGVACGVGATGARCAWAF